MKQNTNIKTMKSYSGKYSNFIIFIGIGIHVLGIAIFAIGFFPETKVLQEPTNITNLPKDFGKYSRPKTIANGIRNTSLDLRHLYKGHFKRVVLVLVDGLRTDFIPHIKLDYFEKETWPFVEEILKDETRSVAYQSWANNPTVTLPRIKATMTGTVPAFLNVVTNLQASSLNEDNVLYQAVKAKRKINFYGDDTWLKLFPNTFQRSEGTVSFFVSDYTEVDNNVTRNLDKELEKLDWDMLILHYLGLDHIGHIAGPLSHLFEPKLKEMDNVVKKIYTKLVEMEEPSLIVLFGDHGMTNTGNHGGVSENEISVPLVFLSTKKINPSLIEKSTQLYERKILQVDMAATLSVVLGLPIPSNNIGSVIPGVLNLANLKPSEQLYALYYNALQLLDMIKLDHSYDVYNTKLSNIFSLHRIWMEKLSDDLTMFRSVKSGYIEIMAEISHTMESSITKYDVYAMVIGGLAVISAFLTIFTLIIDPSRLSHVMGFGDVILGLLGLGFSLLIHCLTCVKVDSCVCHSFFWLAPTGILNFFLFSSLKFFSFLFLETIQEVLSLSITNFIVLATLLHGLSLGSSSFVEEEHQTWYFFAMSLLFLLFLRSIREIVQTYDLSLELGNFKTSSVGNETAYRRTIIRKIFASILLLFLTRLLRSWNQTGNKWASLPDIGDWLVHDNRIILLTILIIGALIIIGLTQSTRRLLQFACTWITIVAILLYHLENGVQPALITTGLDKNVLPRLCYLLILLSIAESAIYVRYHPTPFYSTKCLHVMRALSTAWVLLFALLSKSRDLPLVALIIIQERLAQELVWKQNMSLTIRNITYFWLGMCAFFYQGNSNMLSTIDIASGYVGLTEYHEILVGLLIYCHTYAGLIFWLIRYVCCVLVHMSKDTLNTLQQIPFSLGGLLCCRFFAVAVYLVTVLFLRYHLFIWSVFAPKFLYEVFHSAVIILFACFVIFMMRLIHVRVEKF